MKTAPPMMRIIFMPAVWQPPDSSPQPQQTSLGSSMGLPLHLPPPFCESGTGAGAEAHCLRMGEPHEPGVAGYRPIGGGERKATA